jgi:hypothetical protein
MKVKSISGSDKIGVAAQRHILRRFLELVFEKQRTLCDRCSFASPRISHLLIIGENVQYKVFCSHKLLPLTSTGKDCPYYLDVGRYQQWRAGQAQLQN